MENFLYTTGDTDYFANLVDNDVEFFSITEKEEGSGITRIRIRKSEVLKIAQALVDSELATR